MNKILKFSYLSILFIALGFVACKDAEPKVDTTGRDAIAASREKLTVVDAYLHGDAYETGDGSFKITTTLMSEGMSLAYAEDGTFDGYNGSGFVFEIEFNSEVETALSAGTYVADKLDANDEYERGTFTINPDNTYLNIVHNGSVTTQTLKDIKVVVTGTAPNYTIAITAKNAMDVEVKGNFTGKIEFLDIYHWREPLTKQTLSLTPKTVSHSASSRNVTYCSRYGIECFFLTVETEEGHTAVLEFWAQTGGTTSAYYLETLPSGIYTTTDETLSYGYWDVFDDKNKYDVSISDYRSDPSFAGSYIYTTDGQVYYIKDGEVQVVMNEAAVQYLSLNAESTYGTPITISFGKETGIITLDDDNTELLNQEIEADATTAETIKFNASKAWTATVTEGAAWLTIDNASGDAGEGTIAFTTTANTSSFYARTAKVVINSKGATKTITITQKKGMETSEGELTIGQPATLTQEIEATATSAANIYFKSNAEWTVTIEEGSEWVSLYKDSGPAGDDNYLTIYTQVNTSTADRVATLTLACGDDERTITITQKGGE